MIIFRLVVAMKRKIPFYAYIRRAGKVGDLTGQITPHRNFMEKPQKILDKKQIAAIFKSGYLLTN